MGQKVMLGLSVLTLALSMAFVSVPKVEAALTDCSAWEYSNGSSGGVGWGRGRSCNSNGTGL